MCGGWSRSPSHDHYWADHPGGLEDRDAVTNVVKSVSFVSVIIDAVIKRERQSEHSFHVFVSLNSKVYPLRRRRSPPPDLRWWYFSCSAWRNANTKSCALLERNRGMSKERRGEEGEDHQVRDIFKEFKRATNYLERRGTLRIFFWGEKTFEWRHLFGNNSRNKTILWTLEECTLISSS